MSSLIGALRVTLGLDTAAFEKGASRAEKRAAALGNNAEALGYKVGRMGKALIGLGAAFAGSAVVGSMRRMALEGLEVAGSLDEQSQQLGVTVSSLQRYRFIAGQVGIESATMDKGLQKLTLALGKLSTGTEAQRASLAKFGVSQAEAARLAKMTADQALPFLADKFAALKSPTEQAAFAAELFGAKIGGQFIPLLNQGAGAIAAYVDEYKKMGIEISAAEAKSADEALDRMAKLDALIEGKKAKLSAENAAGIIAGEMAWQNMKVQALTIFGDMATGLDNFNRDYYSKYVAWAETVGPRIKAFAGDVGKWMQGLYASIKSWIGDKLDAVWNTVTARIETVKQAFWGLYDAVVGHSYIPDLVDGIAAQMARLDGVMVEPVRKGTEKATEAFRKMAGEVQGLMDRLFPEQASINRYLEDLAKLGSPGAAKLFDPVALDVAKRELFRQFDAGQPKIGGEMAVSGADASGFDPNFLRGFPLPNDPIWATLKKAYNDNARSAEAANVRVVRSFKDMAEQALGSLRGLADAIKGGSFLDILGALAGLGLQLGSMGAFGKGIAESINAVPKYAGGTSWHPGGLAMVGERGPELVNLPRGSKVWPNGTAPGGRGEVHYHISGNLLTPEFWAQIRAGDAQAAQAGAQGALVRARHLASRRVR